MGHRKPCSRERRGASAGLTFQSILLGTCFSRHPGLMGTGSSGDPAAKVARQGLIWEPGLGPRPPSQCHRYPSERPEVSQPPRASFFQALPGRTPPGMSWVRPGTAAPCLRKASDEVCGRSPRAARGHEVNQAPLESQRPIILFGGFSQMYTVVRSPPQSRCKTCPSTQKIPWFPSSAPCNRRSVFHPSGLAFAGMS